MNYTPAQIEKLILERDFIRDEHRKELAERNAELLEVMMTDADTYNQAAIAVYGDEEAA